MTVRPFHLQRIEDETGISGTGRVADGVVFPNGWCALVWNTSHTSCAFYTSIDEVRAIHGHNGKTRIEFDEGDRVKQALRDFSMAMEVAKNKVFDDWAYACLDSAHEQLKKLATP